jgi:hypothetical protein
MEIRGALPAKNATKQELRQLVEKGCFRPIDKSEINSLHESNQRILPSKLFLKDKHKPDGTFGKLKARLVAGGHRQDHAEYDTVSSLTVSIAAMFIVAAISAKEGRHRMATDVPAAYINAKMDPNMPKVHMHMDAADTALLLEVKPEWRRYVGKYGIIVVQLERALYGLIESAKLWYEEFSAYLKQLGFISNPHDP